MSGDYSMDEMMAVAMSRYILDEYTVFIGTGLPMLAAYLAKASHAPRSTLLFESGVLAPEPKETAKAVGDPRLVSTARRVSGMGDSLLLLHGGRVDLGVLGCAQIDPFGNVNTTAIGPGGYLRPSTRLPGSGGANDIASLAHHHAIVTRHRRRTFVAELDYLTTPGYLTGPGARERASLPGSGPVSVVTDLCVLGFDEDTKEMMLHSIHPGVSLDDVRAATGFELKVPRDLPQTRPPTDAQLDLLRSRIDPDGIYLQG